MTSFDTFDDYKWYEVDCEFDEFEEIYNTGAYIEADTPTQIRKQRRYLEHNESNAKS